MLPSCTPSAGEFSSVYGHGSVGERAVLKLMFDALIRAAERWRSIKVTEFERRQRSAGCAGRQIKGTARRRPPPPS
jgi:hypothetical protein